MLWDNVASGRAARRLLAWRLEVLGRGSRVVGQRLRRAWRGEVVTGGVAWSSGVREREVGRRRLPGWPAVAEHRHRRGGVEGAAAPWGSCSERGGVVSWMCAL